MTFHEKCLRVSNDVGATFGDKINLSNTTASNSLNQHQMNLQLK